MFDRFHADGKEILSIRGAVAILDEWFKAHPEERALLGKLTISGLSSAIKAEKRAELARRLADTVDGLLKQNSRSAGCTSIETARDGSRPK